MIDGQGQGVNGATLDQNVIIPRFLIDAASICARERPCAGGQAKAKQLQARAIAPTKMEVLRPFF